MAGGYLLLAAGYCLAGAATFNRRNSGVPQDPNSGAKYDIDKLYDAAGTFGNAAIILSGISDFAAGLTVVAWVLLIISNTFRSKILSEYSVHPKTNCFYEGLFAATHVTFIIANPNFINYLPDMSDAKNFYLAVFPIMCAMVGVAACFIMMAVFRAYKEFNK
ncbi:hypothetical protein IWW55_000570 [Coemansia sp. RSA 2706]|nr:hypothetical protein LPJ70_000378 [Coemansia sp. RSA 2708]KAJ2308216.1 hypothetical protein IWW55_000570 [Coemansia sp. RSA 2706]KAJ2320361.1 hypothetical protein IWW52_001419 [Coemansia sp. RSA 2704]KAJ2738157.1 hypothetical protein H4R23_001344 [Coemansia sp. Cherry 401B]